MLNNNYNIYLKKVKQKKELNKVLMKHEMNINGCRAFTKQLVSSTTTSQPNSNGYQPFIKFLFIFKPINVWNGMGTKSPYYCYSEI